jgi:hypothetical protein
VGSPGFEKNELARRWQACMHGLTKWSIQVQRTVMVKK